MYYKQGTISNRPPIPVSNPKETHYREHGWIPYKRDIPEFDIDTQRIEKGDIEVGEQAVQKYNVVPLTDEELNQRRQKVSTEKWRLEIILDEDGLLEQINQAVQSVGGRIAKAWNKTSIVNRGSNAVELIRKNFDLSSEQVDNIFQRANDIEI